MLQREFYVGREQTYIKHLVLETYLEKLAYIVGFHGRTINYIDGFAGPWQYRDEALRDTSPFIAINKLIEARNGLAEAKHGPLTVRCFFVENDRSKADELRKACQGVAGLHVEIKAGTFEEHIAEAAVFAKAGTKPFAFTFIDPTGWTGYGMSRIAPLLLTQPGEVLINFMTQHILRFVEDTTPSTAQTFVDLFGDSEFRGDLHGLAGDKREQAIVEAYAKRLRDRCGYRYVAHTRVLNPLRNRTHFHLIYGTRSLRGLVEFREAERKAFFAQEETRDLLAFQEQAARGQRSIFEAAVTGPDDMGQVRRESLRHAKRTLEEQLQSRGRIPYDELVAVALFQSFTWESDLKTWIGEWRDADLALVEGLVGRERVPKRGKRHFVAWKFAK